MATSTAQTSQRKNIFGGLYDSPDSDVSGAATSYMDYLPTFGKMNAQFELTPSEDALKKLGIASLSDLGVRGVPQYNEATGQTDIVNEYYIKSTGEPIGVFTSKGTLGGGVLTTDAQGKHHLVKPPSEGLLEGLAGGIKDMLSDPGFRLALGPIAGALYSGALGSAGLGALAPTAEAGMTDLLFQEGIPAGIGKSAGVMGPVTAEELGKSFAADMAAAGYPGATLGPIVTPPSADAMAADNIDVGGGYNPATGAGDAATAAGAAATGVTSSAGIPKAAAGVLGVGAAKDVASKIKDALGGKDSGIFGTGLSGAGLLAGIGGLAGLLKLIQEDNKRYGVPGRQDTFNPLAGYKFSPSMYQPTIANPAMFKPQGMAAGGMAGYAMGGASDLGSYSDGGRMLKGPGDGMSDSIPGEIGGQRPARLADGEFVVPADVVSGLGNGSTDAGARQLYKMMDRVRTARTGTKKQGREINPQRHMPV